MTVSNCASGRKRAQRILEEYLEPARTNNERI